MKIALTGSSGLIGNAIVQALEARGDSVIRMRRGVHWDPEAETLDLAVLAGQDAIVHLAGETIAGLWTTSTKRRLLESREEGTRLLATSIGKLAHPPTGFLSASAIGSPGNRHPGE